MYEQHFGLSKRPFAHQAVGDDVFIGPQTATLVKRAQRAFEEPDAVICVSGPVGCGKSTVVARTLSALGWQHTVVHIGRIRLGTDETIEFLLRELGLKQMPVGTIRKLAVFRSLLDNLRDKGIRLYIVVEDAARLGNEALAELEALTASDSGVSVGAGMVLMAEKGLKHEFRKPGLARLSQRARLHYEITPLSAAELRAYVAHGLRQAGADVDDIFDDASLETLHALSHGVPRIVNNLIGSVLATASENGATRIDRDMLIGVAADEYGIEIDDAELPPAARTEESKTAAEPEQPIADEQLPLPDSAAAGSGERYPAAAEPEPETVKAPEPLPETVSVPEPGPEIIKAPEPPVPEAASDPEPETSAAADERPEPPPVVDEASPELIQDTSPGLAAFDSGEFKIPELIQDTLPDLEVLAPELAARTDATLESVPESASPEANLAPADPTAGDSPAPDIPTLVADPAAPGAELVPIDREAGRHDPTVAELKPDLEALEQAMATAQGNGAEDESLPVLTPADEDTIEASSDMPKITLDDSIRRKIDSSATEDSDRTSNDAKEASQESETPDDAAEPQPDAATGSNPPPSSDAADLERIAAQLANVKSLEDVDDAMAETLFGAEISMIAAQVVANPPEAAPQEQPPAKEPVELSLVETSAGMETPANETPAGEVEAGDMEREFRELYGDASEEVSIETTRSNGGMDLSASQRLATVRALNAGTESPVKKPPPRGKSEPQPIEDQINTSITQTLKALNVEDIEEAADDTPRKNGFFSRFRKP